MLGTSRDLARPYTSNANSSYSSAVRYACPQGLTMDILVYLDHDIRQSVSLSTSLDLDLRSAISDASAEERVVYAFAAYNSGFHEEAVLQIGRKLLLSGATGAAGSQILRSALADPVVASITILTRRPLPSWLPVPNDDKHTRVVVLSDFLHYPEDVREIAGHGAFIWALGCSSVGMSEADYTKVADEYVVSAVEALQNDTKQRPVDKPSRFVFISGQGSDPEEKNIQMFRNIKGRTEKYLPSLPPSLMIQASVVRPGYFFPSHPVDRRHTRLERA